MKIRGRTNAPWDALFVFHFYADKTQLDATVDLLRRTVAREVADGRLPSGDIAAEEREVRILGRFLQPSDASTLLDRWNSEERGHSWMCWMPNHGIAVVRDRQLDWWSFICFQCENAGAAGPEVRIEPDPELAAYDVDYTAWPNLSLPPKPVPLEQSLLEVLPPRPFPIRK